MLLQLRISRRSRSLLHRRFSQIHGCEADDKSCKCHPIVLGCGMRHRRLHSSIACGVRDSNLEPKHANPVTFWEDGKDGCLGRLGAKQRPSRELLKVLCTVFCVYMYMYSQNPES
jgi:hypothetical protein